MAIPKMDAAAIARDVYALASSNEPIAPLVSEALKVIDDALDSFGSVPPPILFWRSALTSFLCRSPVVQIGETVTQLQRRERLYAPLVSPLGNNRCTYTISINRHCPPTPLRWCPRPAQFICQFTDSQVTLHTAPVTLPRTRRLHRRRRACI